MSDDTIWTRARASFVRLNRAAYGHGAHYSIPVQQTDDDVAVDAAITHGQRLEAAARALISKDTLFDSYLGCLICGAGFVEHTDTCELAVLAALLDGDAPSTQAGAEEGRDAV